MPTTITNSSPNATVSVKIGNAAPVIVPAGQTGTSAQPTGVTVVVEVAAQGGTHPGGPGDD